MRTKRSALGMGVGLLLAAGCASSPAVRYYTLAGRPPSPTAPAAQDVRRRVIGVGPVMLADYLNQPYVIARGGAHTLAISEFDRWGGSLRDAVTRAVVANLSALLDPAPVVVVPWADAPATDVRVQISVNRLERNGDNVILQGAWFVTVKGNRDDVASGALRISEPVNGGGIPATVAAMSRAIETASAAIAERLKQDLAPLPDPARDAPRPEPPD